VLSELWLLKIAMHGQKKRRKRSLDGSLVLEGSTFNWLLISEPQWSTEHGYKGLCISVRTGDKGHRELVIQYPYPTTKSGSPLPLPQRPQFSVTMIEKDIQQAMAAGWVPISRRKTFTYCPTT